MSQNCAEIRCNTDDDAISLFTNSRLPSQIQPTAYQLEPASPEHPPHLGAQARSVVPQRVAASVAAQGEFRERLLVDDAISLRHFLSQSSAASSIPRSAPINMKQSNRNNSNCADMSSISPPSVQFAIGTPPSNTSGNRRRSTSGGQAETPPVPPSTWQISPSATTNFHQSPSALRRSGTATGSPSLPSSALAKFPALSSPTLLAENNNNHPLSGTRAFTLPDMGAIGSNGFSLLHNDSKNGLDEHPITFYAPELPAETLLDVSFEELRPSPGD